jgi:hypothetical protein
LLALEPLHRRDHPDHQQRDEQDQADVLDRPLAAVPGQRREPAPGEIGPRVGVGD